MRRSASEIIKNLQVRIARLEGKLNRKVASASFVKPRDPRVIERNSVLDNPRTGTVYALEYVGGKSHKFYEIIIDDNEVTVNFGRIGTKGQSKTHRFSDHDEAWGWAEEQYKKKRKKDYIDIFDRYRNDEAIGKYSPVGYDPYGTAMSAITKLVGGKPGIESASEQEISKAWPDVTYQGEDIMDNYMKWEDKIEDEEVFEGRDIDETDDFGSDLQIDDGGQECYLGYNQKEDYFVMGFDLTFFAPDTIDAWDAHQDAMYDFEEALQEWESGQDDAFDETDRPDEYDFEGYESFFEGEDDPRNGVPGFAAVPFKVMQNGRIVTKDPVFGMDHFYRANGYNSIKRKFNLIDLRLD